MEGEKFNPSDPEYQQVSDLPKEHERKFGDEAEDERKFGDEAEDERKFGDEAEDEKSEPA